MDIRTWICGYEDVDMKVEKKNPCSSEVTVLGCPVILQLTWYFTLSRLYTLSREAFSRRKCQEDGWSGVLA